MPIGEAVAEDYASLRLSLRAHPLALLRSAIARERCGRIPIAQTAALRSARDGQRLAVAGLVLIRQRPGSANGVIFVTLEDETGIANLVVWPTMFERYRRTVLGARLMVAAGKVQREGEVIHLVAQRLDDRSALLQGLAAAVPPLDPVLARADEVKRPSRDDLMRDFPSRDFH
jgi:error-prone DNA polymerase